MFYTLPNGRAREQAQRPVPLIGWDRAPLPNTPTNNSYQCTRLSYDAIIGTICVYIPTY